MSEQSSDIPSPPTANPDAFSKIGHILNGDAPWLDPANEELFPARDAVIDYGVLLEEKEGRPAGALRCRDYEDVWNHLKEDKAISAVWTPQLSYGVPWFLLPGAVVPGIENVKSEFSESMKQGLPGLGLLIYGFFKGPDPLFIIIGLFLLLPMVNAWFSVLFYPKNLTPEQLRERWIKGSLFQIWLGKRDDSRPSFPVTGLLVAIVAVYLVQLLQSGAEFSLLGVGHNTILAAGLLKDRVLDNGEWWRLLTSGVLHGSLVHIWFNGYALHSTGKMVLALSNGWHLMIVFLASVLGGALLSLALRGGFVTSTGDVIYIPSVGASGGIMGVVGYLLFWSLIYRDTVPPGFAKLLIRNVLLIAVMGIVGMKFIDNAAHFGGFISGIAVAAIVRPRQKDWWNARPSAATKAIGCACVVVLAWTVYRAIMAMTGA